MTKVYYTETESSDFAEISKIVKSMMVEIATRENVQLRKKIPLKVHFGEKGNQTYIPAIAYDGLIEFLREKGIDTAFIETNVLYRGSRTEKASHIALAKEHGFTQIPIIIADGEIGENYTEIEINQRYFQKCKIGSEYQKYDQYIICSHFKGHIVAGFGGALKQLGMGFAARGGKLDQHSALLPTVTASKCTACGKCIEKCGVQAITLSPKAKINDKKCVGCAGCIAVCPSGAINHDWEGQNFKEKMVEYASAAALGKNNIYINFLSNITKDCDCMGHAMQPIAKNIGVLIALDPVAIDTASLDLLQQKSKSKLFEEGRVGLDYAENIGVGRKEYNLIKLEIRN